MARPRANIDIEQLEKLCALQCTYEELAGYFRVSTRTIEKYAQKPEFREAIERGKARGATSVRRAQFKAAMSGNTTMLIWLGKQYLGQRDLAGVELSGPKGGPIDVNGAAPAELFLQRIKRLAERSEPK